MTDAEQRLWSRLRRKQILGVQFYRQKPIGHYIVDFYAPRVHLVLEADGSQHAATSGREYDELRTAFLQTQGLTVIRFSNAEILGNLEGVMERIMDEVRVRLAGNPP